MGYVVTGAYVTAPVQSDQGKVILGFYKNAILPGSVPQDVIDHLLAVNLIEEADVEGPQVVAFPGAEPPPEEPAGGDVPVASSGDQPPPGNASQEEWAAYAIKRGMPRDEAEGTSRNDLRDKYQP